MNEEFGWPDGYDPETDTCCEWMLNALKRHLISVLHGKKYALGNCHPYMVITFCPFCGANLRSYRLSQGYKHL